MMLTVVNKCLRHKPSAAIFTAAMATYNKSHSGAPSTPKQYGHRNSECSWDDRFTFTSEGIKYVVFKSQSSMCV